MEAKALHIVDDWGARLDIKLKEINKAKITEGKSKKEEKEKKEKEKLNKTKKHEDEMKKMTVASGVGVGDVCFFLTMRCFNEAMFSNS